MKKKPVVRKFEGGGIGSGAGDASYEDRIGYVAPEDGGRETTLSRRKKLFGAMGKMASGLGVGAPVKAMRKGGAVRGDGCCMRGKTKGVIR